MDTRDTGTQHKLRMPPELKQQLFDAAKENNRSLNAEITHRLEESFLPSYRFDEEIEQQLQAAAAAHNRPAQNEAELRLALSLGASEDMGGKAHEIPLGVPIGQFQQMMELMAKMSLEVMATRKELAELKKDK